jgi:hypothetical protein
MNLVKYCNVKVENKLKRVPGRAPNYNSQAILTKDNPDFKKHPRQSTLTQH